MTDGGCARLATGYVKIINDEDGRTWIARVGKELKARGLSARLHLEDAGQYEQMQKSKRLGPIGSRWSKSQGGRTRAEGAEGTREEERKAKLALEQNRSGSGGEAPRQARGGPCQVARRIEKIEAGRAAGRQCRQAFTIEAFGQLGGRNVPLIQVLANQNGRFALVAGGSVLGGESPGEGFGFGGSPGRWNDASGGQSLRPSARSQPQDRRFRWLARSSCAVSHARQLFGGNWRAVLS